MRPRTQPLVAALWPAALLFQSASSTEYITANSTTPHENQQNCTCYVIESGADSNTPQYFQFYRFYDFRNFADKPGQYPKAPAVVDDWNRATSLESPQKNILDSDSWRTDWTTQTWRKDATDDFPTRMVNSPANVYIQQNNDSSDPLTFLTLRTTRGGDFQSAGEIESNQKNLLRVSMRMSARVVGDKGAVAGFFTYVDDENETDIEILTNDSTDVVRYTNQPAVDKEGDEVPGASQKKTSLPAWDEWQTHRIDWLEKNSYWYLNDRQVASTSYSIPRKPSYLVANMWSDGGSWSGNMSKGNSAEFQIQWIEITFNTSGPAQGSKKADDKRSINLLEKRKHHDNCKVVCKIDGVKELGTPEIVSVSAAAHASLSWVALAAVGLSSLWMAL